MTRQRQLRASLRKAVAEIIDMTKRSQIIEIGMTVDYDLQNKSGWPYPIEREHSGYKRLNFHIIFFKMPKGKK